MSKTAGDPGKLIGARDEVVAGFDEAAALLGRAEEAVDNGDPEAALLFLKDRSGVLQMCESALDMLREASASAPGGGDAAAFISDVVARASQYRPAESRLALALESERDRLGRELDQVDADEARRNAYGKKTRERATINIIR